MKHTIEGTLAEIMSRRADLNEMYQEGDDIRFVVTDKEPYYHGGEYAWSQHVLEGEEPRGSELPYSIFGHMWWASHAGARRVDQALDFDDSTEAVAALTAALFRWVKYGDCRLKDDHVVVDVTDKCGDNKQHTAEGPVAAAELVLRLLCRPNTRYVTVSAV